MKEKKVFAVLGLGLFGNYVCKTLYDYDYEVIAMDQDMSKVETAARYATSALQGDITDVEQLRAAGIEDADVAIVGAGNELEVGVMTVLSLKELNVPYIIVKANNAKYVQVLEKVGADRVVRPEKEIGERIARQLISPNIADYIEIDAQHSIVEVKTPSIFVGKTIKELALRTKYGMNVLGIRSGKNSAMEFTVSPDYALKAEDQLLVIADDKDFKRFRSL